MNNQPEPQNKMQDSNSNQNVNPDMTKSGEIIMNVTKFETLKSACIKEKEILYDNAIISIESVTKLENDILGLQLNFRNKTKAMIENIKLVFRNFKGYTYKKTEKELDNKIKPNQTITYKLDLTFDDNQSDFPKIRFFYNYEGQKTQIELELPLVITKFCMHNQIDHKLYLEKKASVYSKKHKLLSEKIEFAKEQSQAYFASLAQIPVSEKNSSKFFLRTAEFTLSHINATFLMEILVEISSNTGKIQLYFDEDKQEYALNIINTLSMLYGKIK